MIETTSAPPPSLDASPGPVPSSTAEGPADTSTESPTTVPVDEPRNGPEERLRHDVRQAVSAIMLLAAALERDSLRAPVVAERVQLMHRELDWVAQTVRAEEQLGPRPTRVDAGAIATQVFSALMEGRPCSMTLTRESGLTVFADPTELHRSLRNLLDNATRAAGPGGHVDVRARRRDDEVVVEVEDDGPGFGRIPTRHGVGLASVGRFVRQARAALDVAKAADGGALVTLRLPALVDRPVQEQSA